MWLRRARLSVPAGAVAASAAFALQRTSAKALCDLQELPAFVAQSHPTAPYGAWDDNWDHCELRPQDVAKRLGHEWSTPESHVKAIHRLYAEHTDKDRAKVDAVIKDHEDDLPSLYKRAYLRYAHGGAVTRHIILVRHGQYDEQRALSKRLHAIDPDGLRSAFASLPDGADLPFDSSAAAISGLSAARSAATTASAAAFCAATVSAERACAVSTACSASNACSSSFFASSSISFA